MPHCILEYSANVMDVINFEEFFGRLHEMLSASGDIQLSQIKSRAVCQKEYFVSDGHEKNAFVFLQISIISGRTQEFRQHIGAEALKLLRSYLPKSERELKCSIGVEIREMEKATYFKASGA